MNAKTHKEEIKEERNLKNRRKRGWIMMVNFSEPFLSWRLVYASWCITMVSVCVCLSSLMSLQLLHPRPHPTLCVRVYMSVCVPMHVDVCVSLQIESCPQGYSTYIWDKEVQTRPERERILFTSANSSPSVSVCVCVSACFCACVCMCVFTPKLIEI